MYVGPCHQSAPFAAEVVGVVDEDAGAAHRAAVEAAPRERRGVAPQVEVENKA